MPASKNMPCEIRFHVNEEMREWLRASSQERGLTLSVFLRNAISVLMDRAEREIVVRRTDPLIYEMAETMKMMAEKMGIEIPEKEPENSYQLEGENSAEKEGEIQ